MALVRSGASSRRIVALVTVFLLASLAFIPSALCRSVPSGWDLSLSTGSSDSTPWRPFTTRTQASGYHRLLREFEKSVEGAKKLPQKSEALKTELTDTYSEEMFASMDYANPRSNASGSSDDLTPPLP